MVSGPEQRWGWVIRFWAVDRGWVVQFLATHGGMSHVLWQELAPIWHEVTSSCSKRTKMFRVVASVKSRCGWCTILFHVLWSLYEDSSLKSNIMTRESQGKNFPKYCPSRTANLRTSVLSLKGTGHMFMDLRLALLGLGLIVLAIVSPRTH